MNEFLNFLQVNGRTLLFLFSATGAITGTYLYKNRHFRFGYKVGKKVIKQFKPEIDKAFTSSSSDDFSERITKVKTMASQWGLSTYLTYHTQSIKDLEDRIKILKEELEKKKTIIHENCEKEHEVLTKEIEILETELKGKEAELVELKHAEDTRNEELAEISKNKRREKKYFFPERIQKLQDLFSQSTQSLKKSMLRYVYVLVVFLLLAGDYYITFFIFNDVLKIQFRDNRLAIYLFSGIIALVFLVLIELVLDLLEKSSIFKQYLKKIQTLSILVVGLILFTIYILMVSLSWLSNVPEVLDSLLRLLFVPLILAVALSIRKIQKEYGFSFLFTPLETPLYLALIIIFRILSLIEVTAVHVQHSFQKESFESKTKLTLNEEVENIRQEIDLKTKQKNSLQTNMENDIRELTEEQQQLISKAEEKLGKLKDELAKIQQGCEHGIVSALKLT